MWFVAAAVPVAFCTVLHSIQLMLLGANVLFAVRRCTASLRDRAVVQKTMGTQPRTQNGP